MPCGCAFDGCEWKGGDVMADKEIKGALLELGLFSWGLAVVGSEAELFRLFRDDFENLKTLFMKGV